MFFQYPDEILELMEVYKPFIVNCKLVNPTLEAQAAFDKVRELLDEWGQ